jgi:hypothetical protein
MNGPMPPPPESHRLQPDHLPTPFSAAQIRDASPTGRLITVRDEVLGEPPTYRRIEYVATDDEGATQVFTPTDPDGQPIGPGVTRHGTWLDLQRHASQPADRTTCVETSRQLSWGIEPCWLYVVRDEDGETRFWFAQRLPGMPVVVESWVGDRLTEPREVIAKDSVDGGIGPARHTEPVPDP